ncbi:CheR family methyltransferase [Chlorogloeopsis fritschii PCC 9212]|uniref:Methyltransferase n=1 Tax=Chlorogloeopsis fritschii PCC 6912 TaxID=211165 RepID=A0A433NFB0_CHLFR|nr:protein-glutamate O-methyltransferase CheR [Chlorogloeopsis fritschii]RUR80875.1 methyltransferase [Chlorogloeopsis fritschii PCC 6912]
MTQSVIESLLTQKIGLDANSIGCNNIQRAIERRMADCAIANITTYLEHLQKSSEEWQALIESIIVPETWFFREQEAFAFLKNYIQSEWFPSQPGRVLRVLSVPCSTGEEAYSIAMSLLEAGLSSTKVQIDAVDISKHCLRVAQRAIYNKNSFRGSNLCFQERYFQTTETGYQLCEQVKSMVNFIHDNLAATSFLAGIQPYDVVFCRNLLIYFDSATKHRTIKVLEKLLTPGGLLSVGHAEAGLLLNTKFIPVRYPGAFAYRKPAVSPFSLQFSSKTVSKNHRASDQEKPIPDKPSSQVTVNIETQNLVKDSQANFLETAKTIADQGKLDEANQLCQNYLSQNPDCAEAYVLLGQVQQAMGQDEHAAQSFRKAIYLQPLHQEALIHLALLRENQGDVDSATLLWRRIQRMQKKV